VALALALNEGLFDALDVERVTQIRARVADWLDAQASEVRARIDATGQLSDADRATLLTAMQSLAASRAA
jgi:F0F1-type ATP synthase alpha subunit